MHNLKTAILVSGLVLTVVGGIGFIPLKWGLGIGAAAVGLGLLVPEPASDPAAQP